MFSLRETLDENPDRSIPLRVPRDGNKKVPPLSVLMQLDAIADHWPSFVVAKAAAIEVIFLLKNKNKNKLIEGSMRGQDAFPLNNAAVRRHDYRGSVNAASRNLLPATTTLLLQYRLCRQ